MGEISLFKRFFYRLSIFALVAKIWPDKVVRWCADDEFLAIFGVLYFSIVVLWAFHTIQPSSLNRISLPQLLVYSQLGQSLLKFNLLGLLNRFIQAYCYACPSANS